LEDAIQYLRQALNPRTEPALNRLNDLFAEVESPPDH